MLQPVPPAAFQAQEGKAVGEWWEEGGGQS